MNNKTKIALMFAVLLAVLTLDFSVHATLGTFRTGIAGLLSSEFSAGQSARIGNAFSETYKLEWEAAVNANTYPNTAAGKRQFAASKVAQYAIEITRDYEQRQIQQALPTPTPIP